jgi:hypothetical protein
VGFWDGKRLHPAYVAVQFTNLRHFAFPLSSHVSLSMGKLSRTGGTNALPGPH